MAAQTAKLTYWTFPLPRRLLELVNQSLRQVDPQASWQVLGQQEPEALKSQLAERAEREFPLLLLPQDVLDRWGAERLLPILHCWDTILLLDPVPAEAQLDWLDTLPVYKVFEQNHPKLLARQFFLCLDNWANMRQAQLDTLHTHELQNLLEQQRRNERRQQQLAEVLQNANQELQATIRKMREQDARLNLMANNLPVAFYALDMQERLLTVEGQLLGTLNLKEEELVGMTLDQLDFLNPEQREINRQALAGAIKQNKVVVGRRTFSQFFSPIHNEAGKKIGMICLVLDVSEQEAAQQEAQKQRRLLRSILDALPINIYLKDRQGNHIFLNKQTADNLGVDQDATPYQDDFALHPPEVAKTVRERDLRVWRNRNFDQAEELVVFNGEERYMNSGKMILTDALDNQELLLGYSIDITEQLRAQRRVQQQRKLLHNILDALPINIFLKNRQGELVFMNQTTAATLGIDRDKTDKMTDRELWPEAIAHKLQEQDQQVWQARQLIQQEETIDLQGQERYLSSGKMILPGENELEDLLLGYSIDITEQHLANQKLQKQERMLHHVLDTIPINIYLKNRRGEYVFLNREGANTLGVDQLYTRGKTDYDLMPNDVAQRISREDADTWKIGAITSEEAYILQGEKRIMDSGKLILPGDQVREELLLGYSIDVTEDRNTQLELQDQRDLLDQVMNTDPNLIFVKDYNGNFIKVNQAVAQLFGKTRRELEHANNAEVHQQTEEVEGYNTVDRQVIENKQETEIEETFTLPSGEVRWYLTRKRPLYWRGKVFSLGIATDITHLKRTNQQLVQARKQAEELSRSRELFLASMSHEIRTPLNGIIGLTNLLLSTPLNTEQAEYLDSLRMSGDNLLVLINDILDLAKLTAGKVQIEQTPFSLKELLEKLLRVENIRAREKGLELNLRIDHQLPERVLGDPHRLNQVLGNLLNNALKFTHKGGVQLRVTNCTYNAACRAKGLGKNCVVFEVSDTGIGIPPERLGAIFETFTQAAADTTRNYGGTGLGLSIVKQLVDLMGGFIDVQSSPGQGTTFRVSLPFGEYRQKPSEEKPTQPTNEPQQLAQLPILIVEDHPVNQLIAINLTRQYGAQPTAAENGAVALDKLEEQDFAAVLLDINMPIMDGYTTLRAIRHNDRLRNLPVIAVTAHAFPEEENRCLALGFDDYLSKPFQPEQLYNKLVEALSKRGKPTKVPETASNPKPERPNLDWSTPKIRPQDRDYSLAFAESQPEAQTAPHPGQMESDSDVSPATPEPHSTPAQAVGFTTDLLAEFFDHDPQMVQEMLGVCAEQLTSDLNELRQLAQGDRDSKQMEFYAHRMKTTLRQLGVEELGSALERLEYTHGRGTAEPVSRQEERQLFAQLDQLLAEIAAC